MAVISYFELNSTKEVLCKLLKCYCGNFLTSCLFSGTAFIRSWRIVNTVKNMTDRPPFHTKTANFLPAHFHIGRFWKPNSWHILEIASCENSNII